MSSLQQSAQKRPRCASNNKVNSQNNNCNTSNINLLSLPDEALNNIIAYTMPRAESLVWQWIGRLSHTCRSFRRFAQTYAPTRIVLKDFINYCQIDSWEFSDVRVGFLQSLRDCSWKRQHLKEFHVNHEAVLREREQRVGEEPIHPGHRMIECNDIRRLLQTLITTEGSFPELEWLDIELQSDDVFGYDVINSETLRLMPDALPALHKLCLSQCFKHGIREISPYRLKRFFTNLQTPLTSLSLCGPTWMTDAHVEVMIPIVGENLVRLELVDCMLWDRESDDDPEVYPTDRGMISIAEHCNQLESFSVVGSNITYRGLERVLSANMGIVSLNLSDSKRLEPRAVNVISRYLPRLKELRNYWPNREDWLNDDDGLIAFVNAQEKESGGSERICLKLLGLNHSSFETRGIRYAIEKGVEEIEIDMGDDLLGSILDLGLDVKLFQAHDDQDYHHHIDGSYYVRKRILDF